MIAIVRAQPGKADAFRARIIELAREVRNDPGCICFVRYEALEAEGEFYLYEIYSSPAAFEDHLRSDHVRRYMASVPSVSGLELSNLVQRIEVEVPDQVSGR
jgi:quinol monooxygenase YgiN